MVAGLIVVQEGERTSNNKTSFREVPPVPNPPIAIAEDDVVVVEEEEEEEEVDVDDGI